MISTDRKKTASVFINVKTKRVRVTIFVVEKQKVLHFLRVCLRPYLSCTQCSCAVLYSHLWPAPLYNISPHYLINGTIFLKKKKVLNIKCVIWFSLQLLSEKFLNLRRTERDITTCTSVFMFPLLPQCHHMSFADFVVLPPGHGRSVTDFWGWDVHEAQLRCPDGVWVVIEADVVPGGVLNINSTNLPRPWSPWESSPSRKIPMVELGIEPGTSRLVGRDSDH